MFQLFRRKSKANTKEPNPIPLPEIPHEKINPVDIFNMLKFGTVIWGWFKVTDLKNGQMNYSALLNLTLGYAGLAVYRKEGNYLVKYNVDAVGENYEIRLKIREICRFTNSRVMELFNTELSDAYKLFYDEDSSYSEGCLCYVHSITKEVIENKLSLENVFYVGEEYFLKTDYSNGLPEN